jgi:hypothetical protein
MIDKDRSRRIRNAIREVLMKDWDPIGVSDEPMAADEYDSYLGDVYGLLKNQEQEAVIATYLREVEIKRMGFAEEQTPDRLDTARALKALSFD